MIAYDLLVSSASRPHLLRQSLARCLQYVDAPPSRVIVHEDVQGPAWRGRVATMFNELVGFVPGMIEYSLLLQDEPPILHGPAIHRLLGAAQTDFVLYLQDDDAPCRPVPVRSALEIMRRYGLHQVRFNKRVTMSHHRGWPKHEHRFAETVRRIDGVHAEVTLVPLLLSEKWHFTFGLWRRSYVKEVADWWETAHPGSIREHGEAKLGSAMAGEVDDFNRWPGRTIDVPEPGTHLDHDVRRRITRTYVWGRVGDPPFTEHLGWRREDWRLPRTNRSGMEEMNKLAEEAAVEKGERT